VKNFKFLKKSKILEKKHKILDDFSVFLNMHAHFAEKWKI
jgi:hypothetical protein